MPVGCKLECAAPGRPEHFENSGTTSEVRAVSSPRADDLAVVPADPTKITIVRRSNRIGVFVDQTWRGRSQCKQVADHETAESPRPSEGDASTKGRVVVACVRGGWVEHQERNCFLQRVPLALEPVSVATAS